MNQDPVKRAFEQVMSTEAGRVVLSHIHFLCGYDTPLMTYDPATREANVSATLYNTARRDVWMDLRRSLSWKDAARIENPEPQPVVEEDEEQEQEQEQGE
jgi:hypothetical protein